ncbi:hypothetical protein SRABI80_00548 [Peribacillus frigoritolerans]|nr:hypothetical protein [Peribacillus frigoritolerans]CAH0147634.1 hypothetical protein SRABI80_00548 [Peribacillus frigoritolerans]
MEYRTVEELMIKAQEAIGKTFGVIDIKEEYTVILSSCRFENH